MTRNETPNPRRPPRRERPRTDVATSVEPSSSDLSQKPERQRIAKTMARAGLCSRRDAETWILAGRVSINGEVLTSPARDVASDDIILVDGSPLPTAEKTRLFLFHKPRGLITSDHDPEGRETVADFLRENWPEGPRTVTIGRLDINTEGLLLLTNDGGLARILELPETGWLRRYRVRAKGETDQAALDALADGIEIDGIEYAGIEAKLDRLQGSNCWLTMGLREGKNREIKRVLEHIGLEVNRLIRLSFGPFQLLDLPEGAVEEVRTRVLREQLGENLSAAAGVDFGDQDTAARSPERGGINSRSVQSRDAPTSDAEQTRSARGRPDGSRPRAAKGAPLSLPSSDRQRDADRDQHGEWEAAVPGRPERQKDGPRRHVSALRGGDGAAGRSAPRKRIERTATKDRHDRPVAVERLITRDEPPRSNGRKRVSPAAEGKRVRIARSGGDTAGHRGSAEAHGGRDRRSEGSFRDRDGAPRTTGKPPVRRRPEDSGRPARTAHEGGERPRRERPGDERSQPAFRQERTRSVDDRPARNFRESGRPASGSGMQDQRDAREQRPERSARSAAPAARDGFKLRSGGAPSGRPPGGQSSFGKPASGRPSAGRPSSGRPSSGRPSSGKPSSGKPASGKPASGRPASGRPSSGKPRDRPGGSGRPKR